MSLLLNIFNKQKLFSIMPKRIRKSNIKIKLHKKVNTYVPAKKCKTTINSNLNLISNMHPNSKIEVLNNPVKSANDKKEYKVIRLENGLVACLISDPSNPEILANNTTSFSESESESESSDSESDFETGESEVEQEVTEDESGDEKISKKKSNVEEGKLAAAGLCVGVGSFSDPESIPGLAHFLEHMVFMGSEKYPEENDFDAFLKKRGGSDNASTDCEVTTFYFECLEKHLAKSLDKFAQFFISPLMKRETMTREREAIESEFQMALPSDSYRKEQLLANFTTKGSPVNKFVWGNLITLRDNVTDDVLYKDVHEFRKRHYSAHRMTLAIQARLPLDVLESYVVSCFSDVPSNNLPGDNFQGFAEKIYDTPDFRRIYYIKPVKNVCQLDLTWSMQSLLHLYKSKPHQYVSWLLGHEGKGSLLSYLREKLWALAIYSGNSESGQEHNSLYTLFSISLVLTPEGLNHIYEIIEAIFSYISLLQEVGPQERIYNEMKTVADTSFRFREEETAVDFVEELAEAMHYYPPEDYLTGSNLYFEYKPEEITMVLNKLNPKNLNIMILSSTFPDDIVFDKTEPWFSTFYTDKEIPTEWIENWSKVKPMTCFSLPSDNNFLSTNFNLLEVSETPSPLYPEKLLDTDLVELWYKPDNKFKLPHAFIYYYFMNEMTLASVENSCMLDLFINILSFQLTEEVYPAHVADLSYNLSGSDYGIVIKVDGYNEKLALLLELIIKYMKELPKTTNEDLFQTVKDKQIKGYYNNFIKPSKLARNVRLSILVKSYWSVMKKHQAIFNINYQQFINFTHEFLKNLHIQGLMQGNISKEDSLKINDMVISSINCKAIPLNNIPKIRVTQLPMEKNCCKVISFNEDDANSIITNYYQIGPGTLETLVIIEIIMLMIEEPLFDVLRTKEQLGYHVYCTLCDTYGILGYSITVNAQAHKNTTDHVDSRIEAFVKQMAKKVKNTSEKKLNEIKQDLIKVKQLIDVHLKDEVTRNWAEIVQQDFMFDRIPREIAAIEKAKLSDIKKFLENFTVDSSCRKLSIQVAGHNKEKSETTDDISTDNQINSRRKRSLSEKNFDLNYGNNISGDNNSGYNFITDVENFKKKLYLFPVHKIQS